MTRDEFEEQARRLVDCTLSGVRYFEIDYGTGTPAWSEDPRFDSLDYGLELRLDSDERIGLTWGAEFYMYGISFDTPVFEGAENTRTWDVSQTSRWRDLLGRRIVAAWVHWSWVEGPDLERTYYPQDLELAFEDHRTIYISAFEVWPDGAHMGTMDHITVFFDPATAEHFQVGPFAEWTESMHPHA